MTTANWLARVNAEGEILGLSTGPQASAMETGPGERIVPIPYKPAFTWVDGVAHYLAKVDPETDELIAVEPPSPAAQTLDGLKATAGEAVTAKRDSVVNGGFTFNGVRFQTRPDDRENIAGAVQLATLGAIPSDFVWIAEDNSLIPMDAATVIAFGTAAAAFKSAAIFYARALKDTVNSAADETALSSIDISTGWPETS